MFPDVESVLAILLADMVGGIDHVGTETPPDLHDILPFVRVGRVGGADQAGTDFALVDVDFFAATRNEAWEGSESIRSFLTHPPDGYLLVGAVLLDRVSTSVGPRQTPWLNPHLTRFTTTYRVEVRET